MLIVLEGESFFPSFYRKFSDLPSDVCFCGDNNSVYLMWIRSNISRFQMAIDSRMFGVWLLLKSSFNTYWISVFVDVMDHFSWFGITFAVNKPILLLEFVQILSLFIYTEWCRSELELLNPQRNYETIQRILSNVSVGKFVHW